MPWRRRQQIGAQGRQEVLKSGGLLSTMGRITSKRSLRVKVSFLVHSFLRLVSKSSAADGELIRNGSFEAGEGGGLPDWKPVWPSLKAVTTCCAVLLALGSQFSSACAGEERAASRAKAPLRVHPDNPRYFT